MVFIQPLFLRAPGTNVSGGSISIEDGIVLVLKRMNRILEYSGRIKPAGSFRTGAGAEAGARADDAYCPVSRTGFGSWKFECAFEFE